MDSTLSVPGSTDGLTLPVKLVGAAAWGTAAGCAEVEFVDVFARLDCEADGTGDDVHEDQRELSAASPSFPGLLDLSVVDDMLELDSGVVTEATTCTFEASVTALMTADGEGTGTLSTDLSVTISIRPRSELEPTSAALSVRRLVPDEAMSTARAGDETLHWFAVENNRDAAAVVALTASSRQLACPEAAPCSAAIGGRWRSCSDSVWSPSPWPSACGGRRTCTCTW